MSAQSESGRMQVWSWSTMQQTSGSWRRPLQGGKTQLAPEYCHRLSSAANGTVTFAWLVDLAGAS
jgi:hypothetical protein